MLNDGVCHIHIAICMFQELPTNMWKPRQNISSCNNSFKTDVHLNYTQYFNCHVTQNKVHYYGKSFNAVYRCNRCLISHSHSAQIECVNVRS